MFIKNLLKSPVATCVKVRWYELVRHDLNSYCRFKSNEVNLLLEASKIILADFLYADFIGKIKPNIFKINRSKFNGEVLVISGTNDVVFSSKIGELIANSYPNSKFALFADGHRMYFNRDYYLSLKKAFYSGGFKSKEFIKHFKNKLQLNQ